MRPAPMASISTQVPPKMSRTVTAAGGVMTGSEDWEFAAASGERMEVHVEYERGPAVKGGAEVKFFYPGDPAKYQTFKTDQAIDIMRNPTTTPPDHVKKFSYKAGGGKIAPLFDGSGESCELGFVSVVHPHGQHTLVARTSNTFVKCRRSFKTNTRMVAMV